MNKKILILVFACLLTLTVVSSVYAESDSRLGVFTVNSESCKTHGSSISHKRTMIINSIEQIQPSKEPLLTCISYWECSEWSSCESNVRTRTCEDIYDCKSKQNMPETQISCEDGSDDSFLTSKIILDDLLNKANLNGEKISSKVINSISSKNLIPLSIFVGASLFIFLIFFIKKN